MADEAILHGVLCHYPFRAYEWSLLAADRYQLHTDMGKKVLRAEADRDRAQARCDLLDQLARRHVRLTPRLIRTLGGDRFVREGNLLYGVVDDQAWRHIGFTVGDVRAAGANLARLHAALDGMDVSFTSFPDLFDPYVQLRAGAAALQQGAARGLMESATHFSQLYQTVAQPVMERAARCLSIAGATGMADVSCNRQLTLGGYSHDKIAWTKRGSLATIGFDEVSVGNPEADLYEYARYLLVRGMSSLVPSALDGYDSILGASRPRQQRAISYAGFPFSTVSVVKEYLETDEPDLLQWRARLIRALDIDRGKAVSVRAAGGNGR